MNNKAKSNQKTAAKDAAALGDMIDKEVITVVDSSKSYFEPTEADVSWEMSAIDALQVNYLTRTNRSVQH